MHVYYYYLKSIKQLKKNLNNEYYFLYLWKKKLGEYHQIHHHQDESENIFENNLHLSPFTSTIKLKPGNY